MACAGAPTPSPKTILIADDNDLVRHIYVTTLRRRGFEVVEAEATAVLAIVRERRPDLLILDIMMPDVSGMDLIREIRADARLAGLRVVAATTLTEPGAAQRLLDAGFDVYLPKPIALDAFGDLIAGMLA